MNSENLAYALVQVAHNFGAAAVVGGAVISFWPLRQPEATRRRLARLLLGAWLAQAASGALFGAVSLHYYGQLPDLHAIAVAALSVKIISALGGIVMAAVYLFSAARWTEHARANAWRALVALGVAALTAAAFLRWFS